MLPLSVVLSTPAAGSCARLVQVHWVIVVKLKILTAPINFLAGLRLFNLLISWFRPNSFFRVLEILIVVILLLLFRDPFYCLFFFLYGPFMVGLVEIIYYQIDNLMAVNFTKLTSDFMQFIQPQHHPMILILQRFLYKYLRVCHYYPWDIIFQRCGFLLHKLPDWMEQILFRILFLLILFYLFFSLGVGFLVVFLKGKLIR